MKLLTKEIIEKAKKYPLHSQENKSIMDKEIIVKFFNPYGVGTWLITEMSYEKDNDDWLMYGLCDLGYGYELGYVSFNELDEIRVNVFGCKLPIERDMHLPKNCLVKDLIDEDELM